MRVSLDESLSRLVASGVPVGLLEPGGGASLRESWRQFLYSTLSLVELVVAAELAEKLDTPALAFEWGAYWPAMSQPKRALMARSSVRG